MPISKGRQQYVAIGNEATRLTAKTTSFTNWVPFEDFSSMNENTELEDRSGFNNRGALLSKYVAHQVGKGSLSGKIDTDNVLWALHHTFGTSTPTTALGATTWVFSLLQNVELPTFTVQFTRGDESFRRLRGSSISKLDLDWSKDDGKYSTDFMAIAEETGQSLTPAYTTPTRYLMGRHITAYFATTLAGLGTVASPTGTTFKITSLKVSIETGVDEVAEFSTLNPSNVTADGHKIMVEMEVLLSTANNASGFQTAFEAGTKQAFRFHGLASDQAVIGTSTLKPTLSIALPPSTIKVEPSIPLDEYLTQKISFEVEQPNLAVFTLINSISAIQ